MNVARCGLLAVLPMAASLLAASASAQTVGDRVTCAATAYFCSASFATVGNGVEFTYGPTATTAFLNLDFSSNVLNITSRFASLQLGSGQSVSFRDTTNAFTSATLLANTNSTLTASDIVFNNGLLTVNLGGRTITGTGQLSIGLTTFAAAAPEPATWGMMVLGMGAAGVALRRRGRGTTALRAV